MMIIQNNIINFAIRVNVLFTPLTFSILQLVIVHVLCLIMFLSAMIKQFLTDVVWGKRDYLIIDTPPGTSDEHITVVEQLKAVKPDGAILVSTPQVWNVTSV